ncbi:hypothetical protein MBLNU459_g7040t2 [Dothideomycetes sp. NU459]
MPPVASYLHSLLARHGKVWKAAWKEASKAIKDNLPRQAQAELEPILARNPPRQALHPAARIRQNQSRWISTSTKRTFSAAVRHFTTTAEQSTSGLKYSRVSLPKSAVGNSVIRQSGRAPFASTLRPNLTGGTLGRTAGGYGLGGGRVGGARYFSHGPASQAQVVQNVSQAVRAFFVGGQKAQFDGVAARSGEKRYKAVTVLQDETGRKVRSLPKATPGSYIDFNVNPTITALTPLGAVAGYSFATEEQDREHVNSDGLLDVLSIDFSRALKDLAAVLNDLKKVSALGDLPISYEGSSLRIHFPGCDAETVERLCDELNIQRGVVVQDEAFDAFAGTEIALLFPFCPSFANSEGGSECEYYDLPDKTHGQEKVDWRTMLTPDDSEGEGEGEGEGDSFSMRSAAESSGEEDYVVETPLSDPWRSRDSTPSGYESLHYSSGESRRGRDSDHVTAGSPLEYQGFEGIYRFIEQCDAARRV